MIESKSPIIFPPYSFELTFCRPICKFRTVVFQNANQTSREQKEQLEKKLIINKTKKKEASTFPECIFHSICLVYHRRLVQLKKKEDEQTE